MEGLGVEALDEQCSPSTGAPVTAAQAELEALPLEEAPSLGRFAGFGISGGWWSCLHLGRPVIAPDDHHRPAHVVKYGLRASLGEGG